MKKGINISNLDTNISPKEDFYSYACGGWIKANPLPAEFSSFSTFDQLRENARTQLKELIINLRDDPESEIKGTIEQKISDLYQMGMDEKRLNREKYTPLIPTLERIEKTTKDNLLETIIWLHQGLDSSFFSSGVGPHPQDSNRNILHLSETGLGLGDRDYYLEENEENKKILKAYEEYVKKLIILTGGSVDDANRVWTNVIKIETKIAENKKTREQRRDPLLSFNLYSLENLNNDFPGIEWNKYFKGLDINPEIVNVTSVNFLKFIQDYLYTLSETEIKDYLKFSVISNSTSLMSDDFIDADFELYGKVMSGQKEQKPRWKRAMGLPNSMFGEAVGKLYVKKYFPEENKRYMLTLVENLRSSLSDHIKNLSWMSEETKTKALDKLSRMTVKIGYPDKWEKYEELTIDPDLSYLENVQNASKWFTKDNYSKLKKPVDKSEWHMTPQTVNAYYSPSSNEICFPAAILQPPFFDPEADDALNYGAIGTVIGHEMTHGFDDQGRQFDSDGNLNNWWTEDDAKKFNELTTILERQFNEVEVAPEVYANGKFTLGENIADQGGLGISLTAYLNSDSPKEDIDNFSPLQRFYLSYAGIWANNITDEAILLRTKTDPHSLGKNRVNETLKNIDAFFSAFNIEEGDKMYRPNDKRVIIW